MKIDVQKALGKRKPRAKKRGSLLSGTAVSATGTTLTERMFRAYRRSLMTGHNSFRYSLTYD